VKVNRIPCGRDEEHSRDTPFKKAFPVAEKSLKREATSSKCTKPYLSLAGRGEREFGRRIASCRGGKNKVEGAEEVREKSHRPLAPLKGINPEKGRGGKRS